MLFLALALAAVPANAQNAKQQLLERVFGDAVRLDPATVAKVKTLKPGTQYFVDRNGDGKSDECWFIDTSPRHTQNLRPILVRVIDEDGDLDASKGPDLDSDLYVADYHADGTADVVLDYQDNDGDNDLDEMAFYFFMAEHPFFGKNVLRVWWGRDDGDDNLLWYDEDYTYYQDRCQYRCHFSGEETFVAFGLTESSKEWLSAYENPFLFYDPDGDQCSEVVLRIEGKADAIRAIRYSFDADDDAFGQRTHDYDFSITATADEDKLVKIPPDMLESTKLRGIPTQGWLRRDRARDFVEKAAWSKVMLTWDEINSNTEQDFAKDPHERWEGVIAHGNDEFKQVGGPPCSVFNKRYELDLTPKAPLGLYLGSDDRIHLKGASKGWLEVDDNLDGKAERRATWKDEDGDGLFDRWLAPGAAGGPDSERKMSPDEAQPVALQYESITKTYCRLLARLRANNEPFQFGSSTRRLPIRIEASSVRREDWPVVLDVAAIKAVASEFDVDRCAVLGPDRRLGWCELPHQVSSAASGKGQQLLFLAATGKGVATYWLYYSPSGQDAKPFPARTATAQDWVPPNIGWESNRGAYRAYWGQFDFFGKKTEQLIYPTIGNKSYHDETEWGIDALNVKKASGLGGLTLYRDGRPYLVQNPAGEGTVKFEKRELASGPVCAVVEITASNIIPDKPDASVRMTCIIYAEHQETEIRVQVTGLEGDALLAPGFIKLPREQAFCEPKDGYFGAWGFQDNTIGDIGMGLVFDPKAYRELIDLPEERQVVLSTADGGKLRYWLIGDWRRGRQYPIAPTVDNWKREMRELASVLLTEPKITVGKPEELRTEN